MVARKDSQRTERPFTPKASPPSRGIHMRQSLLGLVLAAATSCVVAAQSASAQTSLPNANYGLIAGETQYLYVATFDPTPFFTFAYDIRGAINLTSPTLLLGNAYRVRVSGRAGVGPLDGFLNYNNSRPDGAFDYCGFFENLDTCQRPGNGVAVTMWDGVDGRRPAVDVYNPSHVYDFFIAGRDAGLQWRFTDSFYSDNYSDMQVEISSLGQLVTPAAVPEPGSSTLLVAGLMALAAAVRSRRSRDR